MQHQRSGRFTQYGRVLTRTGKQDAGLVVVRDQLAVEIRLGRGDDMEIIGIQCVMVIQRGNGVIDFSKCRLRCGICHDPINGLMRSFVLDTLRIQPTFHRGSGRFVPTRRDQDHRAHPARPMPHGMKLWLRRRMGADGIECFLQHSIEQRQGTHVLVAPGDARIEFMQCHAQRVHPRLIQFGDACRIDRETV